jgi:hypothetical protein
MRTNLLRTSAALALLVVTASAVDAQSCLGRPGFALGSVQFGGIATFGNNQTTIGPELGLGAPQGLFAIGSGSYATFDDEDLFDDSPSGWVIDLRGGYEFKPGTSQRLSVCPLLQFGYGQASADVSDQGQTFDVDVNTTEFSGGLFLGYDIRPAGETGMTWVPFGGVRVSNLSADLEVDGDEVDLGEDDETFFPTSLGLGLVFSNGWGLNGQVIIPFGLDDADPRFAFGVTFAFGGRR